jgi:formylglycine-generating enzyme required for sulfatase activity
MRVVHIFVVAGLALLGAVAVAHAEKRVALVIGNAKYRTVLQLQNSAGDARLMADTLRGLGFTLVGGGAQIDLDKAGLDRAVRDFSAQLQTAEVALFYYAGHGIQIHGANYLAPVDANVTREADVEFQMVSVDLVLQQMDPADGNRLNVVILDACRNNPFGSRGLRAADRGLGVMQAPEGTLISFATQPGNAALDGDGDHSPYTVALAESMRRPGLGLFDLFNEIGLSVKRATGGRQQPWVSSSPIAVGFYFGGPPTPVSEAERTWKFVQYTASLDAIDDYIRRFGDSQVYGPLARARREQLTAPPERRWKPGETFQECDDCPEMVVVPTGSFTMGWSEQQKYHYTNESPQHVVTIGRPFAAGRFHVTRDQFAVFATETQLATVPRCPWSSPGYPQEGSHPVVCVSFDDANAYVAWLAKRTGKPYRLLSEAEWEYAARGQRSPGAHPRFWFSNNEADLCQYGNFFDRRSGGDQRPPCNNDGYEYTSPVGHYKPNAFGLYDMFGNARQWTADCWHENYTGAPTDGSAWITWCHDRHAVVRGGSYGDPEWRVEAAWRDKDIIPTRNTGFRVARSLNGPDADHQ